MTHDQMYRPDPFLVAGPEGPIVVPNAVARMLWPAVKTWAEQHRDMGATEKLRAVGPTLLRWEELVLHAEGFRGETAGGNDRPAAASSPHEAEWVTTEEAANALACTRQWVNVLARRGDLESRKAGGVRLVAATSIEDHLHRREAS